jgi:hypothetical protein
MVAVIDVLCMVKKETEVTYLKKNDVGFIVAGSLMTLLFLIVINVISSSDNLWFIYPAFVLILFPIGLTCILRKRYKLFSLIGSIWILTFLIVINVWHTPTIPWVLYTIAPLVMWPVLVWLDQNVALLSVAVVVSTTVILYYLILNLVLSPYYPWFIFPAFLIVWWPLLLYHFKRKSYYALSIHGSIVISVFFIIVNSFSTPTTIWAIFPIFCVLWWPLSMYYFVYKKQKEVKQAK